MRKLWALAPALGLIAVVLSPVTITSPPACAASRNHAALVVDTGASVRRYCVGFSEDSVSGIELIRLAHEQYRLSYKLGYSGQAVCMLSGVGSEEEECFEAGEPYWGYFRGDGSGGWIYSAAGPASTSVEPGDVEGWAYGGGNASSHPRPPDTTYTSVCGASAGSPGAGGEKTGEDASGGSGHSGDAGAAGSGPGGGATAPTSSPDPAASAPTTPAGPSSGASSARPSASARSESSNPRASDPHGHPELRASPKEPPRAGPGRGTAAGRRPGGGSHAPPPAGMIALAAALLLAAAGFVLNRRRTRGDIAAGGD